MQWWDWMARLSLQWTHSLFTQIQAVTQPAFLKARGRWRTCFVDECQICLDCMEALNKTWSKPLHNDIHFPQFRLNSDFRHKAALRCSWVAFLWVFIESRDMTTCQNEAWESFTNALENYRELRGLTGHKQHKTLKISIYCFIRLFPQRNSDSPGFMKHA